MTEKEHDDLRIEIASRMAGANMEYAEALYEDMKDKGGRVRELFARRKRDARPWYKKVLWIN